MPIPQKNSGGAPTLAPEQEIQMLRSQLAESQRLAETAQRLCERCCRERDRFERRVRQLSEMLKLRDAWDKPLRVAR